jgi:hypothetical protein
MPIVLPEGIRVDSKKDRHNRIETPMKSRQIHHAISWFLCIAEQTPHDAKKHTVCKALQSNAASALLSSPLEKSHPPVIAESATAEFLASA